MAETLRPAHQIRLLDPTRTQLRLDHVQVLTKAIQRASERRGISAWALTVAAAAMLRQDVSYRDVRYWLEH